MLLQRLATGATGVKQARYAYKGQRGTRTRMRSIYTAIEGPWHLLFNVRKFLPHNNITIHYKCFAELGHFFLDTAMHPFCCSDQSAAAAGCSGEIGSHIACWLVRNGRRVVHMRPLLAVR